MAQGVIDPPRQSHATYEASALPPSHHGWIFQMTHNFFLLQMTVIKTEGGDNEKDFDDFNYDAEDFNDDDDDYIG